MLLIMINLMTLILIFNKINLNLENYSIEFYILI